ncbi:MAG: hypothetical protein ACYC4L_04925 [Chloroflexota bacterium]
MPEVTFERQYRTPYSEGFLLLDGEDRVGRAELHYTPSVVYCTLVVERELEEEDLLDLIQQIDDDIVVSASVPREDFVVTAYHGHDLGVYEDEFLDEEDLEDEEEDEDLKP